MARRDFRRSNGVNRPVVVLTVLIVALLKLNSLISCIPFWPLYAIAVSAFLGLKYTADNGTAIHTQTTMSVKLSCPHFRGSIVYTNIPCPKQGIDCMVLQWDRKLVQQRKEIVVVSNRKCWCWRKEFTTQRALRNHSH